MNKGYVTFLTVSAGILAGCVNQPIKPAQAAALSGWELCVKDAAVKLYGPNVLMDGMKLDPAVIEAEVAKRGETCQPSDPYVNIAQARMGQQQQNAALAMQRAAVINQALQGYSQTLQNQQMIDAQNTQNAILQNAVNKPVVVNCNSYGSQTRCVGN